MYKIMVVKNNSHIMINKLQLVLRTYKYIVLFNLGEKHLLVPTFLGDSHFSPYILFLSHLVPILKNASRFSPCRYIRNEEIWRGKWHE